jgi:nucleoid DNA-binding protein
VERGAGVEPTPPPSLEIPLNRSQGQLEFLQKNLSEAREGMRMATGEVVPVPRVWTPISKPPLSPEELSAARASELEKTQLALTKQKVAETPMEFPKIAALKEEGARTEAAARYEKIAQPGIAGTTEVLIETGAEILDTVNTAFSRKEPLKRQKAKEAFKASTDVIKRNIENVKLGASYIDARRDFEDALASIRRLERAAKGLGETNIDWLIDSGFGVQADIINELNIMEDLRLELIAAEQQQRLMQIGQPR